MNGNETKLNHVKSAKQTRAHTCHWPGCTKQVPPAMWGCSMHWFKLPQKLRNMIWRTYRVGQEEDLEVSQEYLTAAQLVKRWIKESYP